MDVIGEVSIINEVSVVDAGGSSHMKWFEVTDSGAILSLNVGGNLYMGGENDHVTNLGECPRCMACFGDLVYVVSRNKKLFVVDLMLRKRTWLSDLRYDGMYLMSVNEKYVVIVCEVLNLPSRVIVYDRSDMSEKYEISQFALVYEDIRG